MRAPPGRLRSVAILGGGTLVAAVFGLLFQALLSYHFGAGAETDAWFMSLSIYAFIAKFLMLTNVKSLALPVYRKLQASEPAAAAQLERRLLVLLGVGTGLLSVALVLGAPLLVDVLAPGYTGAQRDLTVSLVRIRTPALAFLAVSTGGLVALEAAHRFGVTVSAQKVVPAAVTLAGFAAVADRFGMIGVGFAGLAGGVAGGAVAAVAMLPLLRLSGSSVTREGAQQAKEGLRGIGASWLRFSGSNAATFVGEWAFRISASLLPVGLFSAVLYGRMVHDLLHASVNDAAQTVSLPRFASAAVESAGPGEIREATSAAGAAGADARVGRLLREGLGALASATVPLGAFVAVTAPWTVALLFGRGRFLEDGMLGPAAVSLQIFALAFVVQGLNQLLFSAAFASGRSSLVNRVQIVGHLGRAALLVPAVLAYSYVGLVATQVAMNILVLGLLLSFAPKPWRIKPAQALRGVGGSQGRGTLVATAVLVGVSVVAAGRLPEPLAVGSVARFGVLAAAALFWLFAYSALAWVLGVPPVRAAMGRVFRRAAGVAVLCLAFAGQGLVAQDAGAALLPAHHWSRALLEILEARGSAPVGTSSAGPLVGTTTDGALSAAAEPWAAAATRAFRWEAAGADAWGVTGTAQVGISTVQGREPGTSGAFVGGNVRLGTGATRLFAHADGSGGPGGGRHALARGGVGVRVGPLAIQAGRETVQLGGGASGALVLGAGVPLDGVLVTTVAPFSVGFLGTMSVTAGVFPMGRYEAVEDPWFSLLRVAVHPSPWIEVGVSRAALVGGRFPGGSVPWDPVTYGPDASSLSPGDLLGMLVGRVTGFDNQVGAFDARVSLAGAGLPALVYAEVGLEDKDRSWGDGGLLLGALVAPSRALPLSLRYEYTAFGDPARWCFWCDRLPAYWYQHARFQSGWRVEDELLGHPLGGYGLQHLLAVSLADPAFRLFAEVEGGRLRRDQWNLLEEERPGWGHWIGGRVWYRGIGGVEVRLSGRTERGDQGWSASRFALSLARFLGT